MIPNVQMADDMLLDPMLHDLVRRLSMDKPNWSFKPHTNRAGVPDAYSRTVFDGTVAPEGKRYVRYVTVIQDGRKAGDLWVEDEYRYRTDNRKNYVVCSERIDNGRRGSRMKSTKIDVAVRNAKKHFDPPKTGELLYDELKNATDKFQRVVSALSYRVNRNAVFSGATGIEAQMYLHALFTNTPPDPQHEQSLRTQFLSAQFEKDLSEYLLCKTMSQRTYKLVAVIEGDYCYYEDTDLNIDTIAKETAGKASVICTDFTSLPEAWQNKLAVLQLMNDDELVIDTGFRYNENTFLLALD